MRFAIADPPYVGCANLYPEKAEVDHADLIGRLELEYPHGWLLCCSTPSLGYLLTLCPAGVRVGAWVKTFASFKPNVNPAYAWEPVIWRGGRPRTRAEPTVRDYISAPITLRRGVKGAKPDAVCYWYFELLNARPGDTLDDLYPGSYAVSRAWIKWQHQLPGLTEVPV